MKLADAVVRRGGLSSRRWYGSTEDIDLTHADGVRLSFSISAGGRGITEIQLTFGPGSFGSLLQTMCAVDRQRALRAMSQEISRQIKNQPRLNHELTKKSRAEILDLAERKYWKSSGLAGDEARKLKEGIGGIIG